MKLEFFDKSNCNLKSVVNNGLFIDNYFVSQKQIDIWKTEIDLLLNLKRVCGILKINFFPVAGTLLGTIRHKGFIPWDDDIDLGLMRKDFNKLLKKGSKYFGAPYFLQTCYTDKKYYIPFIRLRNSDTTGIIKYCPMKHYNQGIFIDIVCIDRMWKPDSVLFRFQKKLSDLFEHILRIKNTGFKKFMNRKCSILKIKYFFVYSLLFVMPRRLLFFGHRFILELSNLSKYNSYCSIPTYGGRYIFSDLNKIDFIKGNFNNIELNIPSNYLNYLEKSYGNWKSIPKDKTWHNNDVIFDPYLPYSEYIKKKEDKMCDD